MRELIYIIAEAKKAIFAKIDFTKLDISFIKED